MLTKDRKNKPKEGKERRYVSENSSCWKSQLREDNIV